jgi:hypothetical protein
MKCGRCGQSLQQTSQNRQCVIQGGRMICETCVEGFFPKCQQCKESITGKTMVMFGDLRWHPQCALCSECKKPLSNETQPPFHVKRGLLFCSICAVHSPYHVHFFFDLILFMHTTTYRPLHCGGGRQFTYSSLYHTQLKRNLLSGRYCRRIHTHSAPRGITLHHQRSIGQ